MTTPSPRRVFVFVMFNGERIDVNSASVEAAIADAESLFVNLRNVQIIREIRELCDDGTGKCVVGQYAVNGGSPRFLNEKFMWEHAV